MNEIYISNNEYQLSNELSSIQREIENPSPVINNSDSADVIQSYFFISGIIIFAIILIVIFYFFVKKFSKPKSPIQEFTKQQTKKHKSKKRIKKTDKINPLNRLETPENIKDCIRLFLERTK